MIQAELERYQGDWDKAYEAIKRADSSILFRNDSPYLGALLAYLRGKLFRSRQEWSEALKYFKISADLAEANSYQLLLAQSLQSIGSVYIKTSDLDLAIDSLEKSIVIKNRIADLFGLAKSKNSLAHIHRLRGDVEGAIELYTEAYEKFMEVGNIPKASRVLCRMGITLRDASNMTLAQSYLERSRTLRFSIVDDQGVAECEYELGKLHELLGDHGSAMRSYRVSLEYAEKSGSNTRKLAPLVQLAAMALRKNYLEPGKKYMLAARETANMNRIYRLLVRLYIERAREEIQANYRDLGFRLLTEAVYVGAHEDDALVEEALLEYWRQIKNLAITSQSGTAVDDYCRRSLRYWGSNYIDDSTKPDLWRQLTLPGIVDSVSEQGKAAEFLDTIIWAINPRMPTEILR